MRAAAALLCLCAAMPLEAAGLEGVTRFTLPNGLEGVVIEDHRAPVVVNMVWYRVGAADDPPGQSGLAHFLEHLMFKGTRSAPDLDFSRVVAANGGEDNAFTAPDYTGYFQQIAADRLGLVIAMEADRMTGLDPRPEEIAAERDVVLEERRQMVETYPTGPFMEAMQAEQFRTHPYGRPGIGSPEEIAAFTLDAALRFYREHYAPDNALLVVAGDVGPAEVEALAARHFGPLPASRRIPPRMRPQEPAPQAARRLERHDARVEHPLFVRSYLAPVRRPGDQRQAAALVLLANLLGGGITSEISQALQVEQQVVLEGDAWYDDLSIDPSTFTLNLVPRPEVSPAAAEAALDALLARFVAEGPDPEALARLKTRLRATEVYALDDPAERASRIAGALIAGLTLEDVADWPGLLQAVTPGEVRAAAAAVLRPEASVTGWLLPAEGAAE